MHACRGCCACHWSTIVRQSRALECVADRASRACPVPSASAHTHAPPPAPARAALYYSGAYYLGTHREAHTWENFAASGALAGAGTALWRLRPIKARPIGFAALLGAGMGASSAYAVQALGEPFWTEGHDFEGYFLGQRVNWKAKEETVAAAAGVPAAK